MDAALLAQALAVADAAATPRAAAAALRERLAPMRVIVVDASDLRDEAPAAVGERRALWFGASDGHCWQITGDPARAAALFVADRARARDPESDR